MSFHCIDEHGAKNTGEDWELAVATHTHRVQTLGEWRTHPILQDGLTQTGRHLRLSTSYTPLCLNQLDGPATYPRVTHKLPGSVLVSYPSHTR